MTPEECIEWIVEDQAYKAPEVQEAALRGGLARLIQCVRAEERRNSGAPSAPSSLHPLSIAVLRRAAWADRNNEASTRALFAAIDAWRDKCSPDLSGQPEGER